MMRQMQNLHDDIAEIARQVGGARKSNPPSCGDVTMLAAEGASA
jgi:hypothetical protein